MPSSISPIYSFLNLEGEKVALSMRRMTLSPGRFHGRITHAQDEEATTCLQD
jgi:hypothetical protein